MKQRLDYDKLKAAILEKIGEGYTFPEWHMYSHAHTDSNNNVVLRFKQGAQYNGVDYNLHDEDMLLSVVELAPVLGIRLEDFLVAAEESKKEMVLEYLQENMWKQIRFGNSVVEVMERGESFFDLEHVDHSVVLIENIHDGRSDSFFDLLYDNLWLGEKVAKEEPEKQGTSIFPPPPPQGNIYTGGDPNIKVTYGANDNEGAVYKPPFDPEIIKLLIGGCMLNQVHDFMEGNPSSSINDVYYEFKDDENEGLLLAYIYVKMTQQK